MNALPAVIPATGELIAEAPTERLAEIVLAGERAADEWADLTSALSDELVRRLDADASWTARVEVDGQVVEIKAPSPTAGTTYLPDELEDALRRLVTDGTLSESAAERALERTLTIEFAVPWDEIGNGHGVGQTLMEHADKVTIYGVALVPVKATPARKVSVSGVNAAKKVPGVTEALEGTTEHRAPASRKATVKVKP